MLAPLPDQIEIERAVGTGRVYAGTIALKLLPRLTSMLADAAGEVRYELKFGRNMLGQRMVAMHAECALPLICQTSLERFELPIQLDAQLGFVKEEADAAGLPEGFEPTLINDGMVDPAALIEDELILVVPVIPRKPDATLKLPAQEPEGETEAKRPNPFLALAALKRT
jgi:uncharacterized protein